MLDSLTIPASKKFHSTHMPISQHPCSILARREGDKSGRTLAWVIDEVALLVGRCVHFCQSPVALLFLIRHKDYAPFQRRRRYSGRVTNKGSFQKRTFSEALQNIDKILVMALHLVWISETYARESITDSVRYRRTQNDLYSSHLFTMNFD